MQNLRIGIIAGEVSGDILGAGLISALQQHYPTLIIEGIGGPQMIAAGCKSLFPMEHLSVMGLGAVLKKLPQILYIRHKIIQHFRNNPPDIFIGIDAPDFNLTVEEKLKQTGIKTVHYVSPSVWAWKQWRIKKIKRAVDKMLTILPFEAAFYVKYQVPVKFVGHPLADSIPLYPDQLAARDKLNLDPNKKIIAILPGSRSNEIKYLAELFIQTALTCQKKYPDLIFIAPMASAKIKQQFNAVLQKIAPQLPIQLFDGQSAAVLTAADAVLLASGTASLEAMLTKCPMVVAYRLPALSFAIASRMVKTAYISLPNLLANKILVPEFIQDDATVKNLSCELLKYFTNPELVENLKSEFMRLHEIMRCNASEKAAEAVVELLEA